MRAVFMFLALTLWPGLAAAQAWQVTDGSQTTLRGAMACAVTGGQGDFCFALGCTDALPLHFGYYSRGIGGEGVVPVEIAVDGRPTGRLLMEVRDAGTGAELVATWEEDRHARLREAMAAGRMLSLLIDPAGRRIARQVPLAGSAAALEAALAQCPVGPRLLSDPVAFEKAAIAAECAEVGAGQGAAQGTVTYDDSFAKTVDFDFDGRDDLVIDYAGASCSSAVTLFCGSAGCPHSYWHGQEGGYRQVMSTYAYTEEFHQRPTMVLKQHGTVCDRVGVETCTSTFEWTGEEFRLIGRE